MIGKKKSLNSLKKQKNIAISQTKTKLDQFTLYRKKSSKTRILSKIILVFSLISNNMVIVKNTDKCK